MEAGRWATPVYPTPRCHGYPASWQSGGDGQGVKGEAMLSLVLHGPQSTERKLPAKSLHMKHTPHFPEPQTCGFDIKSQTVWLISASKQHKD
ncbi:hypothetical protein KUCAC02_020124 [Chaenocephalus aceratus]|uniref:Uncharacterized protein n=1 Tax=Chaenocephalus aceratus TaxID=36190 RepID=A0ACB9VR42_CHAAC|nr:hypothetical protein KUCAC02_020124 [Chaenocephalus aceratus]